MKNKFLLAATFVLLVSIATISNPSKAHAVLASDLLGQINADGTVNFNTKLVNNQVSTPNNLGFSSPYGIAVDPINHRLFASDFNNNRVLVFNLDSNNNIATSGASYVIGQPDFVSNSATTTQSGLSGPTGVTYATSTSYLFVNDNLSSRVLIFDLSGGITNGMNAAHVLGQANFTASVSATTQSGMKKVAIGSLSYGTTVYDYIHKRLFVGDTGNNRTLVFDLSGAITDGMNAAFVLDQANFTSGTNVGSGTTTLSDGAGLAFDPNTSRLFISSYASNRVVVFDVSGTITNGMNASYVLGQTTFAGSASGATQSTFTGPRGLNYDAGNNNLYVAETGNNRVLVFNFSGGISNGMNASYVLGQPDFTTNTFASPGTQTSLASPMSVYSASSTIFVGDYQNNRVLTYNISGGITNGMAALSNVGQTAAGSPVWTTNEANNYHRNIQGLNGSWGLALDLVNHRVFVCDTGNNRVLVFNLDSNNNILSHSASYVLGQPDFTSGGIKITQTGLNQPRSLTYDAVHSRLFVADTNSSRILVYDLSGGITNGMAASYVIGQTDYVSSSGAVAQNRMSRPFRVFYDATSNYLFLDDILNNRVLVYDLSGGITNGMNASYVIGQPDFTTGSSGLTQSKMNFPYGVYYASTTKYLFVSESNNNRVLVFDLSNGITNGMNASYVIGQPNFTTNTATTTQSGMSAPSGVAFNTGNSNLFVVNSGSNRMTVYDLSNGITNGMNATYVPGQSDFISSTATTSQNGMNAPQAMDFDQANNRVWMADNTNNRVLVFNFVKLTASVATTTVVGSSYTATATTSAAQGSVSYSIASGVLPAGLTLDSNTGTIAGTPTTPTNATFTLQATDNNGSAGSIKDSSQYSITVVPVTPVVVSIPATASGGSGGYPAPLAVNFIPTRTTPDTTTPITTTPAVVFTSPTKVFTLGSTGSDVTTLQKFLNSHGYKIAASGAGSPGNETSRFGALTRAALVKFQKDHKIVPASGNLGPITKAYIASQK